MSKNIKGYSTWMTFVLMSGIYINVMQYATDIRLNDVVFRYPTKFYIQL